MKFTSIIKLLAIVFSLSNVILIRRKSNNNFTKNQLYSNSSALANKSSGPEADFSIVSQKYKFDQFESLVNIEIDQNRITINSSEQTGTKSPVYFGKGLLNKFEKLRTKNPAGFEELRLKFNSKSLTDDQSIIFENKENLQFFLFYIVFPPMTGGPGFYKFKYDSLSASFNFILKENANIYQLFSIVSASMGTPTFFQKVKCVELSENQMANIEHRYNTVKGLMSKTFGNDDKKFVEIKNSILNLSKTSCTQTNGKTYESIQSSLKVEKELLFPFEGTIPAIDVSKVKVTSEKEIVYAETDETTHFWMDNINKKLNIFIVDAGSKYLLAKLDSLFSIEASSQPDVNIFITHFHSDHVQALAKFINNNQALNIIVHIHSESAIQFNGWLMENLADVYDAKNKKLLFNLEVFDDQKKTKKVMGPYTITPNLDKESLMRSNYAHFIPNVSWIFEKEGECTKIFTGDFNANPPTFTIEKENFQEYFSNLNSKLSKPQDCKVFFWDYGHFEGKYPSSSSPKSEDKLASDLLEIGTSLGNSYFVFEHYKTIDMFNLIKIHDFSKFKSGGLPKLIKRGTQTFSAKKRLR